MASAEFPETLWAPVAPGRPGGEDLAFAPELDEIRAARRGDDPALAQGDWVTELRTPQWARVRGLCEQVLASRSKDLQVACWYVEALALTGGFPGLAFGLRTVDNLLDRYWACCHPGLDPASGAPQAWEERAGRIEWLNLNATAAVRRIPLTTRESGGYDWLKWEESRRVDNLALGSPQAREEMIREGRIPGEVFQLAVTASGSGHFQRLLEQVQGAAAAYHALRGTLDRRFHQDPPSLEALADAIQACRDLVERILRQFAPGPEPAATGPARGRSRQPAAGPPDPGPAPGPARTRDQAIQELRSIACFFRTTEPHSPVAPLVERAAEWAEMPLERWLGTVIKDPATLSQLKELLDIDL